MKRNLTFLSLLSALLVLHAACVKSPVDSLPATEPNPEQIDESELVRGVVRIKLYPEMETRVAQSAHKAGLQTLTRFGVSPLDEITAGLGATRIERTFDIGGKYEPRQRKAGLHLWYTVYFDEDQPVTRAASSMLEAGGIEIAEPVYMIRQEPVTAHALRQPPTEAAGVQTRAGEAPFDDPLLGKQWHYMNDGSLNEAFKAGADINLFKAWEITTGTSDVIVAIIDSGVEYYHPDLAPNMWVNTAESTGLAGVDDDGNDYIDDIHGWNFYDGMPQYAIVNSYGHGTHVAGTVAAVNNNGIGVGGVAGGDGTPGSGARIMACQINSGASSSPAPDRVLKAFQYATDNGAVIAQCSWGYSHREVTSMPEADKAVIDYFTRFAGTDEEGEIQTGPLKGGLAIFAVGNYGLDKKVFPAAYGEVLSVTAMGADFKAPGYAIRGLWVNVIAPGGSDIAGSLGEVYSTLPDSSYGYMSGTSMACPHVSGVAALLASKIGSEHPGLTGKDIRRMIMNTTNDIYAYNKDNQSITYSGRLGTGYVDAYRALKMSDDSDLTPAAPELDFVVNNRHIEMLLTSKDDVGGVYPNSYTVLASEREITNADFNTPATEDVIRRELSIDDVGRGGTISLLYPDLKSDTEYYFAVESHTMLGTITSILRRTARTQNVNPPANVSDLKISLSGSSALARWRVTADPDDIRALYYEFSYSSKNLASENWDAIAADITTVRVDVGEKLSGQELSYMMTNLATNSMYYAAVQGFDTRTNGSAKTFATFYTGSNAGPVKKKELPSLAFTKTGGTQQIDLLSCFSNDDPIPMTYKVTVVPENSLTYSIEGDILNVAPAEGFTGSGTITVEAVDFAGLSVSSTAGFSIGGGTSPTTLNQLVKDGLTIAFPAGTSGTASVRVFSAAGSAVKTVTAEISSALQLTVDMGAVSSGIYTVVVKYGASEDKHTIVKL